MRVDRRVYDFIATNTKERIAQQFRKYTTAFFDALSEDTLAYIARVCTLEVFQADDVIFKTGDPSDRFFMIADG